MSNFWSLYVIALTVLTVAIMVWLLFATRKMKVDRDDNTTGHVYDGIVEEDNPLPQWWFYMFMISVVFGVGYLIFYPGLGNFAGVLGWTSANQLEHETEVIEQRFAASTAEFANLDISELKDHPKALPMGRRLYANNCSVCHGSDALGSSGFPNLLDAHWQWGGSIDQITTSITMGRQAAMPAWKDVLSIEQTDQLVSYVLSLDSAEASAQDDPGKVVYNSYCAACHSPDGSGNPLLGAPALNDDDWLYGGKEAEVYASIYYGRDGHMPAHQDLLGEARIRLIIAYLLNLAESQQSAE